VRPKPQGRTTSSTTFDHPLTAVRIVATHLPNEASIRCIPPDIFIHPAAIAAIWPGRTLLGKAEIRPKIKNSTQKSSFSSVCHLGLRLAGDRVFNPCQPIFLNLTNEAMRRIFWTVVNAIALALLFASCSSEEQKPAHSFLDQDLSGKIEGESWTLGDGYADITGEGTEAKLHVTLLLPHEGAGCDLMADGDRVLFSFPLYAGLHVLKFDFNDLENNRTVTLFDDEETMNVIASVGAVEITSITDTEITGRIDARADDDNFVNGNFAVSLCQ
jgi:hypothetical protein